MNRFFWKIISIIFIGVYLTLVLLQNQTSAAPQVAAYYLGTLPTDSTSIQKLSKMNLLILSPDQFIVRSEILAAVKKVNPKIIMLAYVPSQSYNFKYWPDDLVYKNLNGIKDEWWLRDRSGNIISDWPGIRNLNMDPAWSGYLVQFINNNIITLPNVDGVFFDMVNDTVSSINHGDVVLSAVSAGNKTLTDIEWQQRVKYLLESAKNNIRTKYLVINGSSNEVFQKYVNGRMYETFPTPWESGGNWSAIMTVMSKNKNLNTAPQLYVFNSNSNNTGKQNDYKKVRFGLASSLLTDNVYFDYDYGDQNHAQLWWYDEYDAELGGAAGNAISVGGNSPFQPDVWRRDYANGLALVNPTDQSRTIDLGGEYEKLIGTQDKVVNDGSIVDSVTLQSKDGILLYKTFQRVTEAVYANGSFLRFYNVTGKRARNGFFSYENDLPGGAKIFSGDVNGDKMLEKIVVTGPRMEIFDESGARWFNDFPLGGNYKGEINVALGSLENDGQKQIIVSGSRGGKVVLYNYHGGIINESFYPLGKKYQGGFSAAIGNFYGKPSIIFATSGRRPAEVVFFDKDLNKILTRFSPFGKKFNGTLTISAGDFNGDGSDELAVVKQQKNPEVGIFNFSGSKINNFIITGIFGNQKIGLAAVNFNNEKKQELMITTKN
ncbi:MAG: putative glycoside hydrolase [Patescibacteria group bacterium]|jgi:hypothetical protein